MKKLINAPEDVVREALAGVAAAHPDLRVDFVNQIVVRADAPRPGKVGLISGGGSGHEPLHGGFVGFGAAGGVLVGHLVAAATTARGVLRAGVFLVRLARAVTSAFFGL